MSLTIVGCGLASPFGLTTRDHVFFLRAYAVPPPLPPFVRDDDKAVDVHACRWLAWRMPVEERLVALAEMALSEALESASIERPRLVLCAGRERPGLSEREVRAVESALVSKLRASSSSRVSGEAGIFRALAEADAQGRETGPLVFVAVDSFVSLEWVAHHVARPPSYWEGRPLPPSEASAVLVVDSPARARRERWPVMGTVLKSVTEMGTSNDDNDESPDGAAMTRAFRSLRTGPVHFAFGQTIVDSLRRREWFLMTGRNADSFRAGCAFECVESAIGAVGAAAGAANLVHGLSVLRHDAASFEAPARAPFVAWAISSDGTRGMASIDVEEGT
jgi:hypothetical protein